MIIRGIVATLTAATMALQQPVVARPQSARQTARILWTQARDSEAELRLDPAIALLRRARAADPTWIVPGIDYVRLMRLQGRRAALRRELSGGSPGARCLLAIGDAPSAAFEREVGTFEALSRSPDAQDCVALWLPRVREASSVRLPRDSLPIFSKMHERAIRAAPELALPWTAYAFALQRRGEDSAAAAVLVRGWQACTHPLERLSVIGALMRQRLAEGDTLSARILSDAIESAATRDGRPGVVFAAESERLTAQATHSSGGSDAARLSQLLGDRAPALLVTVLLGGGARLTDDGQPAEAVRLLGTAARIADSIGEPELRMVTHLRLGRAEVKTGRVRDGLRDLQMARASLAGTNENYFRAEVWHNLAHAYEAAGDFAAAARAADEFVAAANWMPRDPLHVMSWHDAGVIRWEAGWHAAADSAFSAMVRVVDTLGTNHYWAGEYYERIGKLRPALAQYETGAVRDMGELSLDLAGASRVADALGLRDSAEALARRHDGVIQQPTDVPLVPELLVRHGHPDDGIRLALDWTAERERAGNLQGAVDARLQVAALEIEAGRFAAARRDADRGAALAERVHLASEATTARRLSGEARLRAGDARGALPVLRQAAAMADARPESDELLRAHVALGDAYAALGEPSRALDEYDRGAHVVEGVMQRLDADVERARYHDVHDDPFDRALTMLLRRGPPIDLEQTARWLQRRQAASLAAARGSGNAPVVPWPLSTLRSRLGPGDALVDYVMLDSARGALIVTADGASWRPLGVQPKTLAADIARLRGPLTTSAGGAVDLAHAPYDLRLSQALYDAVVRPLLPALAGRRRWLIVPDGPLHYLSFDALVRTSPSAGSRDPYRDARYLIDDVEPWYLPTAAMLPDLRRLPPWDGASVLVVRENVPGGAEEAAGIAATWPRVRMLAGADANETTVLAAAKRAGILHFITHARANAQDPLASYLQLARDSTSDGLLHVAELDEGALRGRLVVLSACETIAGPLLSGEGIMGLARGVLAGGANTVVATQWPVGGTSAPLMRVFYDRLRHGSTVAAALRTAQLAIRGDSSTSHPFHWAAWETVTGGQTAARGGRP